jgi:hypothetical protein
VREREGRRRKEERAREAERTRWSWIIGGVALPVQIGGGESSLPRWISVPAVRCWKSRSCRAFFGCFLLGYFEADPVVREWDPEIAPVGVLVVFVRRVMPSRRISWGFVLVRSQFDLSRGSAESILLLASKEDLHFGDVPWLL